MTEVRARFRPEFLNRLDEILLFRRLGRTHMAAIVDIQLARLRKLYAASGERIGIGVDRVDYSKGLEEKLKALDFLWQRNPALRETFTFIQVAVPSRTDIDAYDRLNEKIERMAWSINERYRTDDWTPIQLVKESLSADRLALLYRLADVCIVSSLADGMNLVAKEFAASAGGAAGAHAFAPAQHLRLAARELRIVGRGGRGAGSAACGSGPMDVR